ncbi:MAG: hypothetical protein M3256_04165, partial [Actinomycetota bacterium]|nr:hypothetical protein [Actinomycetota bacterium]
QQTCRCLLTWETDWWYGHPAIESVMALGADFVLRKAEPTTGFEPATRCLQIRIYGVRSVSRSADKCRSVLGSRKLRADKFQQVTIGGELSGGILVVRRREAPTDFCPDKTIA